MNADDEANASESAEYSMSGDQDSRAVSLYLVRQRLAGIASFTFLGRSNP